MACQACHLCDIKLQPSKLMIIFWFLKFQNAENYIWGFLLILYFRRWWRLLATPSAIDAWTTSETTSNKSPSWKNLQPNCQCKTKTLSPNLPSTIMTVSMKNRPILPLPRLTLLMQFTKTSWFATVLTISTICLKNLERERMAAFIDASTEPLKRCLLSKNSKFRKTIC